MNVHWAFLGGGFGPPEILLILLVLLLFFGGKKLPELARSLGKSMSEFRRGRAEGELEEKEDKGSSGQVSSGGDEAEGGKKDS